MGEFARGRSVRRGPASALVTLALCALLAAACGGGSGRAAGGNQRVEPEVGPPTGQAGPGASGQAAPGAGGQGAAAGRQQAAPRYQGAMSSGDLGAAYRAVLEAYVDPVDHAALVRAATAALQEVTVGAGAMPLDAAPLYAAPPGDGTPERDWQGFARAYDIITQKHPEWAARVRPDHAILRRMMAALGDDHASFVDPEEVRRASEPNFSGIGIRLRKPADGEAPVVVEVFQNSPAARAGVRPGDRIVAVDGAETASRPLTQIVSGIRGAQGSRVVLSVSRGGSAPTDLDMTRAAVEAPRVEGSIRAGVIGVIRIRGFAEGVPEQVQQVLTQGRNRGARAWIVDLRGNPGGSLEALARVAGQFFENRPVALAVDRDGAPEPIPAVGRSAIQGMRVVVLVDRETSSGAEILAAALREHGVAPVVGTATAGSVGVAVPRQLSDGSAVQITIGRLLTPGGARLDRVGLKPDVEAELTVADLERGEDPQLLKAAEVLVNGVPHDSEIK